jgi:hypothetical protein
MSPKGGMVWSAWGNRGRRKGCRGSTPRTFFAIFVFEIFCFLFIYIHLPFFNYFLHRFGFFLCSIRESTFFLTTDRQNSLSEWKGASLNLYGSNATYLIFDLAILFDKLNRKESIPLLHHRSSDPQGFVKF